MAVKSRKLRSYVAFCLYMYYLKSSRTFRIGSKSSAVAIIWHLTCYIIVYYFTTLISHGILESYNYIVICWLQEVCCREFCSGTRLNLMRMNTVEEVEYSGSYLLKYLKWACLFGLELLILYSFI